MLLNGPQNRRLRHLHGVSLRNLDTSAHPSRFRGKTITDDDAPYNLDTPTKRALRNESGSLGHSASFSNLATAKKEHPRTPKKATTLYDQDGKSPIRPGGSRLRRRSTLHWSTASPRARQQKLEDLAVHRLADVWFSVHIKGLQDPIYISEVMERSMNPTFAFFDLDGMSPRVGRSDECILRIWAQDGVQEDYALLLELKMNLRSLQFIGKNLEDFHHPLPQNCVLLHLSDGIYTSFTDLPGNESGPAVLGEQTSTHSENGSSFEALMQLANLDDCIQDALKVREKLEEDVSALLSESQIQRNRRQLLAERQENLAAMKSATSSLTRQKSQAAKRREEVQKSLQMRRDTVQACESDDEIRRGKASSSKTARDMKVDLQRTSEQSQGQVRRIGETLLTIFPIEALKNKALQFSIRNIYLPNSAFDDTNRDEVAAALGFTAQLTHQLSLYLSTPLPYPIAANGSESTIQDPISMSMAQRKYPLHPINVAYKFEYGVFLLNKDIEFMMCKAGLRVLDIRHTLPNLKYLLYVLTAGSGELPARKAGGVRGLLGGRHTPSISRRGSEESARGHKEYIKRTSFDSRRNGSIVAEQMPKEKPTGVGDPFAASPTSAPMPHQAKAFLQATGRYHDS
jgi:UV radiation resistance-associated gene protein